MQHLALEISQQIFEFSQTVFIQHHDNHRVFIRGLAAVRHAVGPLHVSLKRPTGNTRKQLDLQRLNLVQQFPSVVVAERQARNRDSRLADREVSNGRRLRVDRMLLAFAQFADAFNNVGVKRREKD